MGGELDFGLFVSCVQGQPVTRFGTKVLIGADRDPENRRKVRYRTKEVVAIPRSEATRYAREYARAIAEGELKERTESDWREYQRQMDEVGAPREKLKTGEDPPEQLTQEPTHGDEGRSE